MPVRQPVVAGRFYPGSPESLSAEVERFLAAQPEAAPVTDAAFAPWGCMLPHAGYVFSGAVAGSTLSGMRLPRRLVILCPNHTGRGEPLGVWPGGAWLTPLGAVRVDESLSDALVAAEGGFAPDVLSHLGEHSIEVVLPFLQVAQDQSTEGGEGALTVAPVCVGTRHPAALARAGSALAAVLARPENADVGVVVSSDMNHYEDVRATERKDALALERALAADADGLLRVVAEEDISMCGAAPLALALHAARRLGRLRVQLVAHDTSATASGDTRHTVGYAGLRLYLARGARNSACA